jgi:hypothetical protein
MMRAFDLVGTIHGREYSDHGEFVTADDYYHLMLHGEAVGRLKLALEEENNAFRTGIEDLKQSIQREYWDEYAGMDDTREILDSLLKRWRV